MQRVEAMFNDFPFHHPQRSMMGITDGRQQQSQHRNNQLQPFGMFDSMFGSMFKNMRNMMADVQRGFTDVQNDPNSHCYSQSSFTSYTKTGDSAPRVYQASTSTRKAAGGVKETHKTYRDSESGVEKMSIGRHINDRAYVMERSRNRRTGEEEQNQNFVNMDENDAHRFDEEWREKVSHQSRGARGVEHRPRRSQIPVRTRGTSDRLALPSPISKEHSDNRRHRGERRRANVHVHTPRGHRDRDY